MCHFDLLQGLEGITDACCGDENSRKRSGLRFIHVIKKVHLQQLKGMQSSKQDM